ncbi:DUF1589 domain-containing protein [Burkholderia glumae]|uniref:DUF1589 domain-containing protein n=1 Tax=Burkholderia glumae TaxID=337 RepID=UPI0016411CDD
MHGLGPLRRSAASPILNIRGKCAGPSHPLQALPRSGPSRRSRRMVRIPERQPVRYALQRTECAPQTRTPFRFLHMNRMHGSPS